MARKILLADDSVTAQNMGRKILTDAGYEVVTVNNGSAALKKVAEQKPDLIVLDVYMPGYSGLEVCQRLKENRETSRIPILLTVGKLEPFKPEEARRVKADAYVVKPFEASELLTALTRMEDKIVPQAADSQKPGRFAKAIAAFEQFNSDTGEKFGDAESGWKDRLRFPGGKKSSEGEPEPEIPAPATHSFRDLAAQDAAKPENPQPAFERPLPAGLPADITPEEIAAITAAAARLSGKAEAETESKAESETPAQPAPVEAQASSEASAAVAAPVEEAPPVSQAAAATTAEAPTQDEAAPVTLASGAAETAGEEKTAEPAVVEAVAETKPEDTASATAIEPTGQEANQPAASQEPAKQELESKPAEAAAGEASKTDAIAAEAQSEKIPDGEVKAAEEPPQAATVAASAEDEVMAALQNLTPAGSNGEAHSSPATGASDGAATPSVIAAVAAMEIAQAGGARWIAEPVALDAVEASCSLETEMHKAFAAFAAADAARLSAPASVAISGSYIVPTSAEVSAVAVAEPEPVAPEAAQAVANASPEMTSAPAEPSASPEVREGAAEANAASQTDSSEKDTQQTAADDFDRGQAAIKAAAWANWHHIRESIVGATGIPLPDASEPPAQTESTTDAKDSEAMAAAASAGGTTSAPAESGAIASIVDSVLAELRPKIVEEITKKLGNEKK